MFEDSIHSPTIYNSHLLIGGFFNSDINSPALPFGSLCLIALRIKNVHWTFFILRSNSKCLCEFEINIFENCQKFGSFELLKQNPEKSLHYPKIYQKLIYGYSFIFCFSFSVSTVTSSSKINSSIAHFSIDW